MTHVEPDKGKDEIESATGKLSEAVRPGDTVVEEGLAIHIVEPGDPGTIFIAVGEPVDGLTEALHPLEARDAPLKADPAQPPAAVDIPRYGDLLEVAAIRLGGLGPALFFLANGVSCVPGDAVIVAMEEGHVYGRAAGVLRISPDHLGALAGEGGEGAKPGCVVRKATEKDDAAAVNNDILASEALAHCRRCIRERDLDMKLVDVLVLHDRGKMVFYFTAPARIDFRELVKDLVRRYRTRIELRQIGVRHETQMVGALGNCGMVCCCRRYLRKFAPVAIKMAKEQNVFLNPVKISGICGRLLCCLAYEQEHYDEFYRSCPKLGKKYHTTAGTFRVLRASLFRESVTVLGETGEEVEYPLADWNTLNPVRPGVAQQQQNGSRKQESRQAGEDKSRKAARPEKRQRENPHPPSPDADPAALIDADSKTDIRAATMPEHDPGLDAPGDAGGDSIFGLSPQRGLPRGHDGGDAPGKRKKPFLPRGRKPWQPGS